MKRLNFNKPFLFFFPLAIVILLCSACLTTSSNGISDESREALLEEKKNREITKNYNKAIEHFQEKEYQRALSTIEQYVLGKDSTFFPAHFLKAQIYFVQGKYRKVIDERLEYFDKAISYSSYWDLYFNREEYPLLLEKANVRAIEGWAYYEMGYPKVALSCHKDALESYLELKDSEMISTGYYSVGYDLYTLERYDEAIEAYQNAISHGEDSFAVHEGLVEAYNKKIHSMNENTDSEEKQELEHDMLKHLGILIKLNPDAALSWYKERHKQFDWIYENGGLESLYLEAKVGEENAWVIDEIMNLHNWPPDD